MTTHKVYVNTESLSKEELKELQMEKLRELLNEFDPYIQKDGDIRDNLWYGVICGESAIFTAEIGVQKIISKQFGFIKWLVEKDKIDFYKVKRVYKNKRVCNIDNARIDYIAYGKYEILLMLLSIQDNPTEFLISILK